MIRYHHQQQQQQQLNSPLSGTTELKIAK